MVIYRHKDKYSIREMCRFFEVSRSGYYGYVSRMEVPAWDLPLAENPGMPGKMRQNLRLSQSTDMASKARDLPQPENSTPSDAEIWLTVSDPKKEISELWGTSAQVSESAEQRFSC